MKSALSAAISRHRWSARFETWAQPLSATEDQKCENAQSVIRSALDDHSELNNLSIKVFAQGSYVANTNVKADSDVDVCVRCSNAFFYNLPLGVTVSDVSIYPATLEFSIYRAKIGQVLFDRFTASGVQEGDKAFKIRENTYRINADVVPAFEYRKYYFRGSVLDFKTGSAFRTKAGKLIVNWPNETYANGVSKNYCTARMYKKVVRVLKGLRYEMESLGYASAKKIGSFQISCLAYNVMHAFYIDVDLYDAVRNVVFQILYHTIDPSRSTAWTEIDEIKPMFPTDQPGKAQEVAAFFLDLMQYTDLEP